MNENTPCPKEAKKVLKKSRIFRQRVLAWTCIGAAALLAAGVLLYLFVWSQPNQPNVPVNMVRMTPAPEQTTAPTPTPVPTTQPEPTRKPVVMQESFIDLYEQNSDVVAWLNVPGTIIDYPVVQTDNNTDYIKHDFYGEYSEAGTLFLDYHCDITNMYKAAHQIVYGHNMLNGTMLQALTKYADEAFFEQNRYINLNTLYGNYTFEVFAAYETPISFYYFETNFASREAWRDFIEVFVDKSVHKRDITLTEDDVVLTLSTCTNQHDNMRFVVHARLTNPELYDMVYEYIY